MPFLPKLSNWCARLLGGKKREGVRTFVCENGTVARFVFERKRKLRSGGVPKPAVFEPELHPATHEWETSVCGLNGVSNERLWFLGEHIRRDRQAAAAVEIAVPTIVKVGLQCRHSPESEPIEYPEHGVIIGWPKERSEQLSLQQDLAASSIRTLWPPGDLSSPELPSSSEAT